MIAAIAKVSNATCILVVEDEDSRRLRHVVLLMYDSDESDREDNLPRVKRTLRVFPCTTYTAYLRVLR